MIETARGRILVVVLLLAGQAALFPAYAQQPVNEAAGVFAGAEEFTAEPALYLGDRVVAEGFVQQTSPTVVETRTSRGPSLLTITDHGLSPTEGDKLRVYGVLTASGTIQSRHAFVVPQSGRLYTWGISFAAGVWVLLRLLRHWRLDPSRLCFSPRDEPLSFDALGRLLPWGGE
jgi:hypothetical protein